MLDKLKGLLLVLEDRFTASSEKKTKDNGYLSYRAEWHSAAWGFGVAFLAVVTGQYIWMVAGFGWMFTRAADPKVPGFIPYPRQFMKESAYVVGHAVAGVIVGLVIRVWMLAVF